MSRFRITIRLKWEHWPEFLMTWLRILKSAVTNWSNGFSAEKILCMATDRGRFGGQRPPLQHRCSAGAVSAGPGAMMAVIVLTDNDVYTVPERIETGVVMVVVLFITYLLLLFSDAILRVIGDRAHPSWCA
jgi:hypothetical protein